MVEETTNNSTENNSTEENQVDELLNHQFDNSAESFSAVSETEETKLDVQVVQSPDSSSGGTSQETVITSVQGEGMTAPDLSIRIKQDNDATVITETFQQENNPPADPQENNTETVIAEEIKSERAGETKIKMKVDVVTIILLLVLVIVMIAIAYRVSRKSS